MSFFKRLQTGLRYAFSGKTVAALAPSWQVGQPEWATSANYEILVKEGYRKNELIFACLNATAAAASQIRLELVDKDTEEVVEQHPLLDLIRRPNERMNESDFWAAIVLFQKLAGRGVFEVEYSNRGLPVALWPLRPDRIHIISDTKRPVPARYIYKVPGLPDQFLDPSEVLDFPLFDPLDRFKVYPPVAVAGRVADVDSAATDYIKMIYEHGGMPPVYLKTTQSLQPADIENTRARWRQRYGGRKNWLEPAILDRDQDVHKLAWDFREMGFEFLDARNEVRICLVLDVPPILIGAKAGLDSSTYSNYELADRAWWRNDLLPMFNNLIDVVDHSLLPMFDTSNRLAARWDVSKVTALQENVDAIWERARKALISGGLTLNEYYGEIGMEGIGTPGEVRYMSLGTQVVPALQGALLITDEQEEMSDEIEERARKALAVAENAPDDDERRRHERVIDRALRDYLAEQQEEVLRDASANGR